MKHINEISEQFRHSLIRNLPYMNSSYIREEDGKLVIDRNMAKYEIFNYRALNGIHSSQVTVEDEMKKNGICITDSSSYKAPKNIKAMASKKTSFKDIYTRYSEIRHEKPIMFVKDWEIELAEAMYPFIKDAYTKLGDDKIKGLQYRVGAIQDTLTALSKVNDDLRIVEMADRRFPKQTPIPSSKVKKGMQEIYDTLGIDRKAKATDLEKWYDVVKCVQRIDGKNTSCVKILRNRLIRTDF